MEVYKDPGGDVMHVFVVSQAGILKCLYAPFRVICIKPVDNIGLNTQVYVEAVIGTTNGGLLYIIFQKPIPHSNFQIVIRF